MSNVKKISFNYLRSKHHTLMDEAYSSMYVLDNGDSAHMYRSAILSSFGGALVRDIGLTKKEAKNMVIDYFNKDVGQW